MNKIIRFSLITKILMVIFWIGVIFAFLYSPLLKINLFKQPSISILAWADMIDEKRILEFEKQTGIKVNINFYENNEELFAKLKTVQGQEYDLITITDVGANYLRHKKLIKPIDKSKLDFWHKIEPHLLNHYFDPENQYTVPYNWDIFGLGVNTKFFGGKLPHPSWKLLFDDKTALKKIAMTDEAYDAVLVAGKYLFGTLENFTPEKLLAIKELLKNQKKLVEVYTDYRADYFLKMGISPIAFAQSAYIYRAMKEDKNIAFIIPNEGTFLTIDSLVIPALSKKDDLVYKFINFLLKDDEILNLYNKFGYLPVIKNILYSLNLSYLGVGKVENIFSEKNAGKFSFFRRTIPLEEISKLWTEVKA